MRQLAVMCLVLLVLVAGSAYAGPIAVGNVELGNSWSSGQFHDPEPIAYDFIGMLWISGATFERPTLRDLNSGWTSAGDTASGALTFDAYYSMNFNDTPGPAHFIFAAFAGTNAVGIYEMFYGGGGAYPIDSNWSYNILGNDSYARDAFNVPEPGLILLLAIGIGSVVLVRRKCN
jgi:hypothetical protein